MKLFTILMLCVIGASATNFSYSQQTKLSLKLNDVTVRQVLLAVEENSEYIFLYNEKLIDVNRKVNVTVENKTLEHILEQTFEGTDNVWKIYDRQVLILKDKKTVPPIIFEKPKQENKQKSVIRGKVVDSGQMGLPGVSIVVKGTTQGTVSNFDGEFELADVPEQAVLVFSFVGMRTQEIELKNRTFLNVTLQEDAIGLEEVVAVGYGVQKKANLTGAVISVQQEQLEKITTANATEMLQGQVAGLITRQSSGLPGDDNAALSIRGFGNPLVLVDGVERRLSSIDPSTIESVSVLKDAAAAIYGSRSGNGVILVKTKRGGKSDELQVNYDGNVSVQQFTHKPGIITDAGKYTELWREAELNAGINPTYSEEEVQKYYQGVKGYESYDWYNYTFRDWARKQKHSLNVQGGNEKVNFFAGVGYTDHQSVITSDDYWYKRYNIRSNIDAKINENLSLSCNLNFINEHKSRATTNIWRGVYNSQPMAPTHFEGQPDLVPVSNLRGTQERLVGEMNKNIEGGSDEIPQSFNANLALEYNFPWIKGLKANFSVDYYLSNARTTTFRTLYYVHSRNPETGEVSKVGQGPGGVVNNLLKEGYTKYERIRPKFQLNFERSFENHDVKALVVGEYFDNNTNGFSAESQNLLSNELLYLTYGDQIYHRVGQNVSEASRASIAGRFNYAFKQKYLLEGTFRYDASSIFPPESRWGFFPSVSAGWRISEEAWMEDVEWLDNLKLRASYSQTGYDANAIRYDYFSGYALSTDYVPGYSTPGYLFGNTSVRKIWPTTLANNSMTWETMTNYNVGVDANMYNGLLNVVVEGFYRKRSDILAQPLRSFPSTFGAGLSKYNLNSIDDRGIEIEVSHRNKIGEVAYNVKGIVTYARSKNVKIEEEAYTTEDEMRILQQTGQWRNRFVGYVSDGIFKTQAEIDSHPIDQDQAGNSTLRPGDIKYVDLNNDDVISWADQKEIGYGTETPDLNYSMNLGAEYKGFSVDVLLHGASMFSGYVSGFAQNAFDNGSTPLNLHYTERYHEVNNPNGTLPAVFMGVRGNNVKTSDFWLKDITFLRLKNVNLAYQIPTSITNKLNVKRVKVYMSASNLAVWSNLGIYKSEFDPESSLSHNGYPPHRTISFGINVTL